MLLSQPRVVGTPAQGDEDHAHHTAFLPTEPLHLLNLSVKALSCTEFSDGHFRRQMSPATFSGC